MPAVDDFSRRCLAAEVDTSLPGLRVCRVLEQLVSHHGKPEALLGDTGPEFTGKASTSEPTSTECVSTSSLPENRPKTRTSRASMASSAMSASTNTGLPASRMPGASSTLGAGTTTPYDLTAH